MNPLEIRIKYLEELFSMLIKSDRYTFQKTIQIFEGRNIQTGTGTGTSIGTAPNQKIGFYGSAAVQPATTGTNTGFTQSAGAAFNANSSSTGGIGSTSYNYGDVVLALKQMGALKQ